MKKTKSCKASSWHRTCGNQAAVAVMTCVVIHARMSGSGCLCRTRAYSCQPVRLTGHDIALQLSGPCRAVISTSLVNSRSYACCIDLLHSTICVHEVPRLARPVRLSCCGSRDRNNHIQVADICVFLRQAAAVHTSGGWPQHNHPCVLVHGPWYNMRASLGTIYSHTGCPDSRLANVQSA